MKRCPTCNKTFTDQNLSFCIDDGTPLLTIADSADETTVVAPQARKGAASDETEAYVPRDWQRDYQPPGSFEPAGHKRKVWPWVVGIVGLLIIAIVGLGIVFTTLAPRMLRANANSNNRNVNVGRNEEQNSNSNFNSTEPDGDSNNANVDNNDAGINEGDAAAAPTDSNKVLGDLTAIEHEWTVANINADKKKLDQILADDYVGTSEDGKSQGKAEYLKTIERDTSIEKWDFEDLKVALRGDRATLTGKIRIQISGQEAVYHFTDKFVWRDGRWQAVNSEVAREK